MTEYYSYLGAYSQYLIIIRYIHNLICVFNQTNHSFIKYALLFDYVASCVPIWKYSSVEDIVLAFIRIVV